MDTLRSTLNCGIVSKHSNNTVVLSICRFKDIYNKIIPLFNEYKIRGVKNLDFQDFCKIAEIIYKKAHLTLEGLKEIRKIKFNMNKERYKKGKVAIGKVKYLLIYCVFLHLDVQFISFPIVFINMFIICKEYSLIGKIRSFKLRVFSSNLSALDVYLYI
jgi:hypothetical protein